MTIKTYKEFSPNIAAKVFVDDTALVIGDVTLGEDASIWPMCVLRGDVNRIQVGGRTNIQDGSVLHVTHPHKTIPGGFALTIGDNVTVGHKVILHGCHVHDNCLIGMGSTVMDGAVIQPYVILGAGSLVSPGKVLEGGHLWLGSPARKVRPLTDNEHKWIDYSATHYVNLKNDYLE